MTGADHVAQEGRQYPRRDSRGQDWLDSWHPPAHPALGGQPHGSAGICFPPEGNVVLVTWPGGSWGFPAGE